MTAADQRVLAFCRSNLDHLGSYQGITTDIRYMWRLLPHVFFAPRSDLERDPRYKQIVPYTVIAYEDKILMYSRSSKAGDARLHGKKSIGIGGHVEPRDDGPSPYYVLLNAAMREIDEEIFGPTMPRLRPIGLINDDLTPVGKVHFGVLFLCVVDSLDIIPKSDEITDCEFVTFSALRTIYDGHLEPWSRLAVDTVEHALDNARIV